VIADLNGDGIPDLIGSQGLFLGNGDGTFQPTALPLPTQLPAAVADLNGDGKPDQVDSALSVFLSAPRPTRHLR
jgi:hypothetical protein